MAANAPMGSAAPLRGAHAAAVNLRRAILATVGVAAVIAFETISRSLESTAPPVFVAYSLLIWVAIPAVVTLGIAGLAALARDAELPMWLTAAVAGLATATWVSWGIGEAAGWGYGLLFGLGGASAGIALEARWPVPVRVVAAAAIATATALLVQLTSVVVH